MKYLIVGAGGTGGCIAAFLARAGKDVTIIARGTHLATIEENGLMLETQHGNFSVPVPAFDMEHYGEKPDIVFLCVKGYSVDESLPFLEKICDSHTIVIPVLNLFNTGAELQTKLPNTLVTDGCIYIASEIKAPGTIWMAGEIFRVIFGVRNPEEHRPELDVVNSDLAEAGIGGGLSDNIRRDALLKFSCVSPMAASGLFYDVLVGDYQQDGPSRDFYTACIKEVVALSTAMGVTFLEDPVARNLTIIDELAPTASTSLKRDIDAGRRSETDGLIYIMCRMGRAYGVPTPCYDQIARKLGGGEFVV